MCICYNWVAEGAERQALAGDVSSSWGLRRHSETCAGCIVSWITCISLLPRIDITICPSQKRYEKRYDRAKASGPPNQVHEDCNGQNPDRNREEGGTQL